MGVAQALDTQKENITTCPSEVHVSTHTAAVGREPHAHATRRFLPLPHLPLPLTRLEWTSNAALGGGSLRRSHGNAGTAKRHGRAAAAHACTPRRCIVRRRRRPSTGVRWLWCLRPHRMPKRQPVPGKTGTGRQSGGWRPGLGPEAPAGGWDWMGLGLGSAGRRPGLGLEPQAEGWDWPGLSTGVPVRMAENMQKTTQYCLRSTSFHFLWTRHRTLPMNLLHVCELDRVSGIF